VHCSTKCDHHQCSRQGAHHPLQFGNVTGDVQEVKSISLQLLLAVHQLHQAGLGHRDLKPDNVMVEPVEVRGQLHFNVKLVDLGLAATQEERDHELHAGLAHRVGCLGYTGPEVFLRNGELVTPRDMYAALAACWFHCSAAGLSLHTEHLTAGSLLLCDWHTTPVQATQDDAAKQAEGSAAAADVLVLLLAGMSVRWLCCRFGAGMIIYFLAHGRQWFSGRFSGEGIKAATLDCRYLQVLQDVADPVRCHLTVAVLVCSAVALRACPAQYAPACRHHLMHCQLGVLLPAAAKAKVRLLPLHFAIGATLVGASYGASWANIASAAGCCC